MDNFVNFSISIDNLICIIVNDKKILSTLGEWIMNRLDATKRAQVLSALIEGNSTRATSRMANVKRTTVTRLLLEAGAACAEYQDKALRNLSCKRVQCDEISSFFYAKDKNLPADKQGVFGFGSIWTWTALDADSKLICSGAVGTRDAGAAYEFM